MYSLTPPVAHRNLKTLNILVDPIDSSAGQQQQQQYAIKIAGFGLSQVAMETMLPHTGGEEAYMAPEVGAAHPSALSPLMMLSRDACAYLPYSGWMHQLAA